MAIKIGEAVSRVRNVIKGVTEDAFITDRFIYSVLMKYANTLIKRDSRLDRLLDDNDLYKEIPCIELIDVDRVEACCIDIRTQCTFKRSKEKLPKILDLGNGPSIRSLTTLDYSKEVYYTHPTVYMNMTKTSGFKYNKNKYYWIVDDYLFIPDVEWEAVRMGAIFDEDIKAYQCGNDASDCDLQQERDINIPEYLFSEAEQMTIKEILTGGQIPSDGDDDSKNVLR